MDPQFPARLYTAGEEPPPGKSVNHMCRMELMPYLEKALREDEWEYICNSPLGVFLKFYKLNFAWSSRKVHHMLTFQLACEKKYEIWCLIGNKPVRFSLNEFEELTGLNCNYVKDLEEPAVKVTKEMKRYWAKLGLDVEVGPCIAGLSEACQACESWTREERIRLGYLGIYVTFIDAIDRRSPTRVKMARLVMDIAAFERYPWGRVAFKRLIKSVKDAVLENYSYTLQK